MPGRGNEFVKGKPTEDDVLNTVYILDSAELPFYQAEEYHQFHNGLRTSFPKEYTKDLKRMVKEQGRIVDTGCPEAYFF